MANTNDYRDTIRSAPLRSRFAIRVRGSSMAPVLRDGDRVTIERSNMIFPGDIIAFHDRHNGQFVIHRVAGYIPSFTIPWRLLTFGDSAQNCDAAVERELVLGKVIDVKTRPADRARSLWRLSRQAFVSLSRR
jgi:signal peptidase I